jgi:hypothetical protein
MSVAEFKRMTSITRRCLMVNVKERERPGGHFKEAGFCIFLFATFTVAARTVSVVGLLWVRGPSAVCRVNMYLTYTACTGIWSTVSYGIMLFTAPHSGPSFCLGCGSRALLIIYVVCLAKSSGPQATKNVLWLVETGPLG